MKLIFCSVNNDGFLDNIEENSDLGFTPEDYNFHAIPRTSRQVSNRSGGTAAGGTGSGQHTPSHFPRNSYVAANDMRDPRSIHSAPNSIGSSGITGSLSALSAHYLNLAQQTERFLFPLYCYILFFSVLFPQYLKSR